MAKSDPGVGLLLLLGLVFLASRGAADKEGKPPEKKPPAVVVREARVTFNGLFAEVQGA